MAVSANLAGTIQNLGWSSYNRLELRSGPFCKLAGPVKGSSRAPAKGFGVDIMRL